jgi:hypothetical protein
VVLDLDDVDQQTLLVRYPSVMAGGDSYIQPTVKIEAGAKSALDPHRSVTVQPYVFDDMPQSNMQVTGVTTIDPERTFWDKVVILHGLRRWHDARGQLRHQGHRVSRHYYDIYKLLASPVGPHQQQPTHCDEPWLIELNGPTGSEPGSTPQMSPRTLFMSPRPPSRGPSSIPVSTPTAKHAQQ